MHFMKNCQVQEHKMDQRIPQDQLHKALWLYKLWQQVNQHFQIFWRNSWQNISWIFDLQQTDCDPNSTEMFHNHDLLFLEKNSNKFCFLVNSKPEIVTMRNSFPAPSSKLSHIWWETSLWSFDKSILPLQWLQLLHFIKLCRMIQ